MHENARPDFEKTIAAFEAHCKSCATCGAVRKAPAGAPESDAKNLCPTGAQLLVADLENATEPWMAEHCADWDNEDPHLREGLLKKAAVAGDLSVMSAQKWNALAAFARKALVEKKLVEPDEVKDSLSNVGEPTEPVKVSDGGWAGQTGPAKTYTIPPKPKENADQPAIGDKPRGFPTANYNAFNDHAKACEGCMNAYNSAKPELMCDVGSGILANREVAAQGGEEAGKPGGTVTIVNSVSKEQAVGILKWVAGEHIKPISVNMDSGETVTIEELERIAGTGHRPEHRNAESAQAAWDAASLLQRKNMLRLATISENNPTITNKTFAQLDAEMQEMLRGALERTNSVEPVFVAGGGNDSAELGAALYGGRA